MDILDQTEVNIKNKNAIKEPANITKREKINITIPKDKLIALDIFCKKAQYKQK